MKQYLKKFLIWLIAFLIVIEPLTTTGLLTAKATIEEDGSSALVEESTEPASDPTEKPAQTNPALEAFEKAFSYTDNSSNPASITTDDSLFGVQDPRLIFNTTDLSAIRSLYCLSDILPDFYTDIEALHSFLPASTRPTIEELTQLRISNYAQYQDLVYQAQKAWGANPDTKTILEKEKQELINSAYSNDDPTMVEATQSDTPKFKNLRCLIGSDYDMQELFNIAKMDSYESGGSWHSGYLDSIVNDALKSTEIDIRVIKLLNYLVIPKNQGGAGHWRVRVKKILQDSSRPYSNESETIRLSLGEKATDTSTVTNCANMTAAECGVAQGAEADEQTADSNITAEDQNGDAYDLYLASLDNAETGDVARKLTPPQNISAHTRGQAVDIMELDDIRCTLTVVKKRRIGGNTTTREKKVDRPIKLAWQTSSSYDQSGGNSVDMMGIMRGIANDEMQSLLTELNGDVTNYDGDLSTASFSDIVGIIGKTIFGQLLNSPGHNFAGFNAEETLKKLGGMYFADYLGLPREIFTDRSITSLEDLEVIIGETALEKRAGLPFGALESLNYQKTLETKNKVYDLEGTLINVGQRKLEYEMNLNPGDMKEYFDTNTNMTLDMFIGNRVVEKGLSLPKGAFRGSDFKDLKKNLGDFRASVIFQDPTYVDSTLRVAPGTTKELMSGTLTPTAFVVKVGETRKADTLNGFKYLSANNSAYQLPDGAWENALLGKKEAFVTVGQYTLSRVVQQNLTFSKYLDSKGDGNLSEADYNALKDVDITASPDDVGAAAAQQWLLGNLSKNTATDKKACDVPEKITQKITVAITKPGEQPINKEISVNINEDNAISLGLVKGDLSRMFGCASASPRSVFSRVGSKLLYYGVANKLLDSEGNTKIDLMDTTPELNFSNSELAFYVTRITRILELVKQIKSDWENESGVELGPITERINEVIASFNNLNFTSIAGAQETARNIASKIDGFLVEFENIRVQNQEKARKVDATIINVNELIRSVSEIIAGKPIASADLLTIKQIDASQSFSSTWTSAGANGSSSAQNGKGAGGVKTTGFSPAALFDLLVHRISAVDFFIRIGAAQAENGLGLPQNSLYYLVQNYEKAGIKSIDAFYLAIGQAKIEQEYSMPSFYFQGDVLSDKVPNFETDFTALYKYASGQIETNRALTYWNSLGSISTNKPEDYLKWVKTNDPILFASFVDTAKLVWFNDFVTEYASKGGQLMNETTLDDVAKNVVRRGYNDAIRGAGDDIMFRLGISGRLAALEAGGFNSVTEAQALKVDKKLGIKDGSTASLIKKQKVPLGNGADLLGEPAKQQLAAGLMLSGTELIDVLLKLINGDITLSQVGRQGLGAEYVETNPYLKQYGDGGDENTCPISYVGTGTTVTWQDFRTRSDLFSQTTFEGNTYCIVDKVGKHCFKNKADAQTYATAHEADKYDDVISAVADAVSAYAGGLNLDYGEIRERLIGFINGASTSVFTTAELDLIQAGAEEQLASDANPNPKSLQEAGVIAANLRSLLDKIFTRTGDQTPLATYKRAVGHAEAKRILGWKLFSSLGIDIPPGIFGSDDLYAILSGDYKPLYRVGAYYLDKSLGFEPGTTQMIISALNPKNLKCALADAGAKMLGNLVGLNSVPIRANSPADLLKNIGQAKVEETLSLPRGTFYGASMTELITRLKPMNFALIFKIPLTVERLDNGEMRTMIDNNDMAAILGASKAGTLKNATGVYQLRALVDYLSSAPALTAEASTAVARIDTALMTYIPIVLQGYGSGALPGGDGSANQRDYYYELKQFKTLWDSFDGIFALDDSATAKLARGELTPDQYIEKIGSKLVVRLGAVKLGEMLGLSEEAATAAADTAINFQKFFVCEKPSPVEAEGCLENQYYHKWGLFYSNLATIFGLDLDSKAGLPAGTMQRIFNDPSQAYWVLLEIAAKKLDEGFGLEGTLSFSELYRRVNYAVAGTSGSDKERDDRCITDSKAAAGIDSNQYYNAMQANQVIINGANAPNATAQDKANAEAAARDNARMDLELKNLNAAIQTCQNNWRKGLDAEGRFDPMKLVRVTTAQWIRDGISEKIHDKILNVEIDGVRVGVDMPIKDIEQMVFWGDLRYLQIVGMAMAVNYFTDKVSNEQHPVPANMRVSYDDIRQIIFPDAASVQVARDAANWASVQPGGESFDRSRITYSLGDICPPSSDFVTGLTHCTSDATNPSTIPARNGASIANDSSVAIAEGYNYDLSNPFNSAEIISGAETYRTGYESERQALLTSERCLTNQDSCQAEIDALDEKIGQMTEVIDSTIEIGDQGERNLRQYNKERAEFRLMDQMLYGIDQNVFAGFSQALFKGSPEVKLAALQRYIINGLKNGKLFGIEFNAVPNVDDWLRTLAFLSDLSKNGLGNSTAALNTFVDNGGFTFFTGYLSGKSKDWIGVELSPAMVGGILVGVATGNWGSFSPMADNSTNVFTSTKGVKVPTLGNAVVTWGMNKLFAWADKALGIPVGKSYEWFSMAKSIYNADKAYRAAKSVYSASRIVGATVDTVPVGMMPGQDQISAATQSLQGLSVAEKTKMLEAAGLPVTQEALNNFPPKFTTDQLDAMNKNYVDPKKLAVAELYIKLATEIVTFFLDKWLAGAYADIEDSLNLVPGTVAMVVDAAVGVGIASIAVHTFHASAAVMKTAMSNLYVALAMFVIMNLFGVYKIDVKLTCTADGYWPEFEPMPSSSVADISGIGTWDGMKSNVMQQKSIESAQYKASRLIGDVLYMQENDAFKAIVPSQIMTGRQEDVATWNDSVSDYMCKWINPSLKASGGICEDRAGLWANPQTIGWTHIGY